MKRPISVKWLKAGAAVVASILIADTPAASRQAGDVNFPTSSRSSKAQQSFIQGVTWLHNFGYEEAIDAFQAAQIVEPGFAMAYWGEALANSQPMWFTENVAAGRRILTRFGPARVATPREQGYVDAVRLLFGEGDRDSRHAAYAAAMGKLSAQFPDDPDAACFYALALLATVPRGSYDLAIRERAGSIAAGVFRAHPRHPGAMHVLIHAYDDREHAELALPAARAYAAMAPPVGHALHMPAHIFLQLGIWDQAVLADQAAYAASEALVRRRRQSIVQRDYHSLSWLAYEYLQRGQYDNARRAWGPLEEAIKVADKTRSRLGVAPSEEHTHPTSVKPSERATDSVTLRNELATMRAYHVIETRQWDLMKGATLFENADELFALGMSAGERREIARAESTRQMLEKYARSEPDATRKKLLDIMEAQIAALVARAKQKPDEALKHAARGASIERTLPRPVGRPQPIKPSNELYGELLLEAKRPRDAMGEFEYSLWRAANRPRSLLGLARAQAAAGDRAASRKSFDRLLEIWRQADANVPELPDVRKALGIKD